jgi:hypothetical protein
VIRTKIYARAALSSQGQARAGSDQHFAFLQTTLNTSKAMQKQRRLPGRPASPATTGAAVRLAGMTRTALIAASLLALTGAVACAQTPELDSARIQILEPLLESARLQALDAQRAAYAAQAQLRTEQSLQALEAGRAGVSASALTPLAPLPYSLSQTPAASISRVAPIDGQHAADADRILQLQAEAMARSNARILAIRPAL